MHLCGPWPGAVAQGCVGACDSRHTVTTVLSAATMSWGTRLLPGASTACPRRLAWASSMVPRSPASQPQRSGRGQDGPPVEGAASPLHRDRASIVIALRDTLHPREPGPPGVRVAVVEPKGVAPQPDAGSSAAPSAEDLAGTILFVLTRPPHVSVAEVLVRPTAQRD